MSIRSNGWTYLLVRLASAREGDLHELFERAWRHEAPKRLVAAYDAATIVMSPSSHPYNEP